MYSVAEMANGDLLVGGRFATAGSLAITANNVARFDGAQWHAFGPGLSYVANPSRENVPDVAQLPNGEPIAIGAIEQSGTTPVANIVSWDGSSWVSRSPWPFFAPRSLLVRANGEVWLNGFDIVAANLYRWSNGAWVSVPNVPAGLTAVGGIAASNVARWDGSNWFAMPGTTGVIYTLHELLDTSILVGAIGLFVISPQGSVSMVPDTSFVSDVVELADGRIAAIGSPQTWGGSSTTRGAVWDGAGWTQMTYAFGTPDSLARGFCAVRVCRERSDTPRRPRFVRGGDV